MYYILGIVCSPRKGGNTEILVEQALEAARVAGAQTEMITVAERQIAPCDACGACETTSKCSIDDGMQEIYAKLEAADGIIFGTPVYFINVSAQAKAIIDRTYCFLLSRKLRGKVAAAVIAARRVGGGNVLSLLYTFFTVHRMITAGGSIGYGREKGEVRSGVGMSPGMSAMEEARAVGQAVVRLLRQLYPSKQ